MRFYLLEVLVGCQELKQNFGVFRNIKISKKINPDEVVGYGATL